VRRRDFLASTAAAIAALSARDVYPSSAGEPPVVTKRMVTTTEALTPSKSVTTYNNFYESGG
jgi:DMSO/TMAO reductase YedYZ molybdopterin-dependent catalytic subunit